MKLNGTTLVLLMGITLALSSAAAAPARADDTDPRVPTIIPAVLTTQQKAENQSKITLAKQKLSEQAAAGMQAASDTGFAYWNLYPEPQAPYAFNWCGAGTASVLSAGWQIKTNGSDSIGAYSRYSTPGYDSPTGWYFGGDAYMQHLAYDRDVVQDQATTVGITEPSRDNGMDYSDETHVANAANAETASMRGIFYYAVWQGVGSLSNLDLALQDTVGGYEVPLATVARPCPPGQLCLPGWTGASTGMYHWVAAVAYDIPNNVIVYTDSAAGTQAPAGQNPYGYHEFSRSTFFNTYMTPYSSGVVVW